MIKVTDIYWLAGLFEGEGWFGARRDGSLAMQVEMTDRDVIERVRMLVGFGTLRERELPSGLVSYRWLGAKQPQTAGLMMTLLPLMGERRRKRIIEALVRWRQKPLARHLATHCKHGHELSGYNLVIVHEGKHTKRQCRICRARRSRESAVRRAA